MNARIFEELSAELEHATGWFGHDTPTITSNSTDQHEQEQHMSLAVTAGSLGETRDALNAAHAANTTSLDRLGGLIGEVEAVAQIAGHPLMQAAEAALHVDPNILQGFIAGLNALAASTPKPEPQ